MKKYVIAFIIMATIGIGAVFVLGRTTEAGFFARNREQFINRMFDRVAAKLNMSDEQKTQAKAILEDSKTRVQPLMEKMRQNHEAAKIQGTDGIYNEAKTQELANEQADIVKQLVVEKEKTKAELFAVLNPNQREQAKQMLDNFGKRFGKGGPGGFGEGFEKDSK